MSDQKTSPGLAWAVLFFYCLVPTLSFLHSGCASPERVAYKTLAEVAQTVDLALSAYYDQVIIGKVPEATQVKVRNAKARYQAGMNEAIQAARGNTWTQSPEDVNRLADALSTILAEVLRR